ncbi:acyl-CoA carboxylase subunit epsilon [Streptomyces sp. NPDC090119]|uniref:acyl-CoA carboxylase subunit epsilon n=1 Tax=Streptomyces sp. NPDC090119 TaxID=3365951 RepID=UPI00382E484A
MITEEAAMDCWKITGGTPTAEELAAVTAVLTALAAEGTATPAEAGAFDGPPATVWHRPHHNPHASAGTWQTG